MERSRVKMGAAKLCREGLRLRAQLHAALRAPIEPYLARRHDRTLHGTIRQTDGAQALTEKVAIYLIYQPNGVSASSRLACETLAAKGYSTFLISNAPLAAADRAALAPLTWRIVERPNFGYDFGGYRDGVRLLREAGVVPDAMVILNDSIWWPVFPGDETLDRLEGAGADMAGLIQHRMRRRERRGRAHATHLQSYFYWFSGKTVASEAFRAFWDGYRPSGVKYNTIRRGEMRLTDHMTEAGFSAVPIYSFPRMRDAIEAAGSDALCTALRYAVMPDAALEDRAEALRDRTRTDAAWGSDVADLMAEADRLSELQIAFPWPAFALTGLNILKKTPSEGPGSRTFRMRDQILAAIDAGDLPPPHPTVLAEIRARQARAPAAEPRR